ncbi:MAG: hypothetical protein AAFW68_14365, partial [Pseudomonadota bacterium]
MLGRIGRLLTLPFRIFGRFFRNRFRDASATTRTATNAGGSVIASAAGADLLEDEYKEEPPSGIEAALFKQLPRPRLTERSASEMTLPQAEGYAADAKSFYRYSFPIFARGDFFYEEVEQDYLNAALSFDGDSIDKRFLEVTTLFRRTLNDNTRSMLLFWTPVLFIVVFGGAFFMVQAGFGASLEAVATPVGGSAAVIFAVAALVGVFLAFLIYSWPYKVVQQRNLMNLDNYVTSKFARINNNFQVAKRRALNVERDKRMNQREELKDEAGSWTIAYHWFAMRLLLCELVLRNKFYQVRRNTTLYWVGGLLLTGLAIAGFATILIIQDADAAMLAAFAAAAAVYVILSGLILRGATSMMF